jgi:uncharacterized protein (TIGR02246 family)
MAVKKWCRARTAGGFGLGERVLFVMVGQGGRMRSFFIPGIASIVLLAGCQATPTFNPEDPAVVAAIESSLQAAMDGAARADADKVVAAFGEDATFVTGDVMLSGRGDIHARFRETYSGVASQVHTLREKRVRVLAPDVALVTATGEGTYTDQAGWTSEPVGLAVTIVFARQGGDWRAVHAHQSIAD